jgi:hypothetical protein
MKRSGTFLRLAAIVAVGACGTQDPPGNTGGTGGGAPTGSGGSPMAGSGGSTGGAGGGSGGTAGTGGSPASGGTGGSASPDAGPMASGDYFPFKIGNRWTYQIQEAGGLPPYRKEQVIVRMEPVGGNGPNKDKMAFRLETRKYAAAGGTTLDDATISWQVREGNKVLRYRETSCTRLSATLMNDAISGCNTDVEDYWNPPRARLDERPLGMEPAKGMTWMEMYQEFKNTYDWTIMPPRVTPSGPVAHTDTWSITDVNVSATVPAGTFNNCVVFTKKTFLTQLVKTYTFCKGVGKVREVGLGQTEELATMPVLK